MCTNRQCTKEVDADIIGGLVGLWLLTVIITALIASSIVSSAWERAAVREGHGHFSKPLGAFRWGSG